jgi:5-formyltetrahydrofolate cyclo-ligase
VRLVFPRSIPGERRLAFARAAPGALVRGPLGALEPPPGAPEVALDEIECVLVPGVAFSEDGLRLGRGGGYYDATLKHMPRARRVGLAFDAQVLPALPREPHDVPLDAVVTETRTLVFPRESPPAPAESR